MGLSRAWLLPEAWALAAGSGSAEVSPAAAGCLSPPRQLPASLRRWPLRAPCQPLHAHGLQCLSATERRSRALLLQAAPWGGYQTPPHRAHAYLSARVRRPLKGLRAPSLRVVPDASLLSCQRRCMAPLPRLPARS